MSSWIVALVVFASSVGGCAVGGLTVWYRFGRWQQKVDDRLLSIETQLAASQARHVPALGTEIRGIHTTLQEMREDVRGLTEEMRRIATHSVTVDQCKQLRAACLTQARAAKGA